VSRRRLKLSQARSRSGVQVTSGTRVGAITGTGEIVTITGGDLGLTPILTRIGGRDGGPAGQVDLVHPVTTAGQVDLTITNTTVSAGDGHGGPGGSRTLRTRTV
jgi:hypothetical protein